MQLHNGIDWPGIKGEAIVHGGMYDGWMRTETDMAGGIGVDVVSKEKVRLEDGTETYIKCRYWHLSTPIGWDGKEVKHGQIIGLCGNTGASSGTHLHFGVKPCDKEGNSLDKWNGYYGAIDPTPYLRNGAFAGDSLNLQGIGAVYPTQKERQQMIDQLGAARYIFLEMREMIYKYV
jgi:murein DD-endopeptidase MepM/ murein hydrolase activator NlpD